MQTPVIQLQLPESYAAPAGRDEAEAFAAKVATVKNSPILLASLNAIPSMVMILNENRQIVAANQAMHRVLQVAEKDLLQKRPGEILGCVRVAEGPDGCGTSRHCVTCGAANAILESQTQNAQVVRECRILINGDSAGALDLRVAATPIEVDGTRFIVVAVDDISQPKRIAVLQRVFFHDVLNTAGCISGYADFLANQHEAVNEVSELLTHLSEQLVEEIRAQRDLVLAESGDLVLQEDILMTGQVLDELRKQYLKNPAAVERNIELGQIWQGMIRTDRRLLMRILGNMLKNGIEATAPGETVRIDCREEGPDVVFSVHNPGVMPEHVQLQMFQRSFSTKEEAGRGIGTYSMKLLGERDLGGHVHFVSRLPEGTIFFFRLPKTRPAA